MSYLISFQYFVHQPAVASARYRVYSLTKHIYEYTVVEWTVLYMETIFFFPLIDRLVCTIQNNQTLDALIKHVEHYHILYSGQSEIRFVIEDICHCLHD